MSLRYHSTFISWNMYILIWCSLLTAKCSYLSLPVFTNRTTSNLPIFECPHPLSPEIGSLWFLGIEKPNNQLSQIPMFEDFQLATNFLRTILLYISPQGVLG